MDIEELIERLHAEIRGPGGLLEAAATALSTLQAENEKLRAELEYEKEHANAYYEECGQWEAENTLLKENWRISSRIGMPLSRIFAHLQNSGGNRTVDFLAVGANLKNQKSVSGSQNIRAKYVRAGLLNGAAKRRTDMERLTKRNYHDFAIPIRGTDGISMLQAINRLAAIEDILGDEYDLDRLRVIMDAEQRGGLIVGYGPGDPGEPGEPGVMEEVAADNVGVVRCGRCKYFGHKIMDGKHACENLQLPYCKEDDFCSYGQKEAQP